MPSPLAGDEPGVELSVTVACTPTSLPYHRPPLTVPSRHMGACHLILFQGPEKDPRRVLSESLPARRVPRASQNQYRGLGAKQWTRIPPRPDFLNRAWPTRTGVSGHGRCHSNLIRGPIRSLWRTMRRKLRQEGDSGAFPAHVDAVPFGCGISEYPPPESPTDPRESRPSSASEPNRERGPCGLAGLRQLAGLSLRGRHAPQTAPGTR